MFEAYDKKAFWKSLGGIVLMMVLMKTTGGAGFALIALFSLGAVLLGRTTQMLFGLMLANVALMGNGWFFPRGFVFGLAHRGMLVVIGFCLAARVFGGSRKMVLAPLMLIFPFLMYMLIPSLQGWAPVVSLLKLLLFSLVFIAYAGAAKMALSSSEGRIRVYRAMVVATLAFFILGSVAIAPFPSISYMGAEELANDAAFLADLEAGRIVSLFKGMTWHSQSLGPLIYVFCPFLQGDMLFNINKPDKLYLAMIAICPILVYKTSSRTAMAVLICGILIMLILFQGSHTIRGSWKSKVMSISTILGVLMFVAVATIPDARQGMVNYALKYSNDDHAKFSTEEMMATRQALIDRAIYNWRKKPLIGNGFQVSDEMQYEHRKGFADYLSAPIEKGVWISAVLEEGGVIGLSLFCFFWITAFFSLWAGRFYGTASLLLSLVIMNMAEFTIFSMSGIGGFIWCLVFMMAILEGWRVDSERIGYGLMPA